MYNSRQYNTGVYNGGFDNNPAHSLDRLVFDGFSLSDGTTMAMQELVDSGPTREFLGGTAARADGQYTTAYYFREKIIEASGVVVQDTAADLDGYLDTSRGNLRESEANLDVTEANGTVKRYVAT